MSTINSNNHIIRNDNYAEKQLETLRSVSIPEDITVKEFSKYIGHCDAEEDFIIQINFIIETKLSFSVLNNRIHSIDHFQNAAITAYNLEDANKLNFTGIQKEITNDTANGYYIISIKMKPKTLFDKRN